MPPRPGPWPRKDSVFFQAEDGIRGTSVTGVQTCALPILPPSAVGTPALRAFFNGLLGTKTGRRRLSPKRQCLSLAQCYAIAADDPQKLLAHTHIDRKSVV